MAEDAEKASLPQKVWAALGAYGALLEISSQRRAAQKHFEAAVQQLEGEDLILYRQRERLFWDAWAAADALEVAKERHTQAMKELAKEDEPLHEVAVEISVWFQNGWEKGWAWRCLTEGCNANGARILRGDAEEEAEYHRKHKTEEV